MSGIIAATLNAAVGAAKSAGSNLGVAVGLPAGQNLVEGTEANLMVGAAAANSTWRKAAVAALAAIVTLVPLLAGIWFLYKAGGAYTDYAVAIIVVGIGVHEVQEGLEDKPEAGDHGRAHRLDGPLGIDPADRSQIVDFQSCHGLKPDGVLGPRTRGAILAELHRHDEEPCPNRLSVDVTSEPSVAAFQRRVGLEPDGIIGPRTQGALAAESARRVPDPADRGSIRRFQRQYRLVETGLVDAATQGAIRALGAESVDGFSTFARSGVIGTEAAGDSDGRVSPDGAVPLFADRIDLTSREEIARFQRDRGLPASGSVDAPTQGALRAENTWHRRLPAFDPADPTAVRRFQSARQLPQTGIVDEQTQAVLLVERDEVEACASLRWGRLGLDPTDPASIRRFQALHRIERSGEIDQQTRTELRRTEMWLAGIDPAARSAVVHFQEDQGLEPTGEVDAETQGAMRLYRSELQKRYEMELPDDVSRWYPVDPTDPASIKSFQQEKGLPESGTIDAPTQAMIQAVVTERTNRAVTDTQSSSERGIIATYRDAWPGYFGFLLEGGEAGLFTIGIAQGTHDYAAAAIAGGAAFTVPWLGMIWLRDWLQSRPKWVFELTIGTILASAGTIFGIFRATGIFG